MKNSHFDRAQCKQGSVRIIVALVFVVVLGGSYFMYNFIYNKFVFEFELEYGCNNGLCVDPPPDYLRIEAGKD